jgi:hypothetical protein
MTAFFKGLDMNAMWMSKHGIPCMTLVSLCTISDRLPAPQTYTNRGAGWIS